MGVDPSALEALRAAVSGSPDNPHLRAHLANALLDSDNAIDALAEAQRAIALAPAYGLFSGNESCCSSSSRCS